MSHPPESFHRPELAEWPAKQVLTVAVGTTEGDPWFDPYSTSGLSVTAATIRSGRIACHEAGMRYEANWLTSLDTASASAWPVARSPAIVPSWSGAGRF